ncbi:hypothetical protein BP6252_11503 [Coleophoma cylindrospora]|uniref:Ankyrin repeat protein n=1 Tax=Coleophoma cylindrospora TaxID=1849047 RepID=A0A3D8QK76_9HELO|nr:hypothetical protein BP6252_11503 [Coleophoma cylindrospora]
MIGVTASRDGPVSRDDQMIELYDKYNKEYAGDNEEKKYLSMRNHRGQKKVYLEQLVTEKNGLKRRQGLEHEEERIAEVRRTFWANPTKKSLVEKYETCQKAWREEAKERRSEYLRKLQRRKEDYQAGQLGSTENTSKMLSFENEERILNLVPKWSENASSSHPRPAQTNHDPADDATYGLKACIMHFTKGKGGHTHRYQRDGVVTGKFPDQKVQVEELLKDSPENPLRETSKSAPFRYFHLPTNNMAWIEAVLAYYYEEVVADPSVERVPGEMGRAERLLAREYWKGQMHGGSEHPVHARYMRPRCASVPLNSAPTSASPPPTPLLAPQSRKRSIQVEAPSQMTQNFAIFMPYLHWESNSRRTRMAEVIQDLTRKSAKGETSTPDPRMPKEQASDKAKTKQTVLMAATKFEQSLLHAKYKHLPSRNSESLGAYLMTIAKIADAMDYEADERLLRRHLHTNPPLHIRRTLDQSYFWTLEDTTSRDRDQVVYRGTKAGKIGNARVVMVDQLWMWILDEHTILTSFPRRWGRNKPDPSGVHKSLRERLKHVEPGRINSIFDLAFIIIDQCSRVFFDRTKPTDQRPEVMDIFSNAIAHITGMKTVAFETFWQQMEMDSPRGSREMSEKIKRAYLNINPEGALLRESQDIVEELRMMARIFTQQYQVVKDFKKALEKMNEREDERFEPAGAKEKRELLNQAIPEDTEIRPPRAQYRKVPKSTLIEAGELLDQILERKVEITDLEEAATRTCAQLQDLLALKQQQTSIIEARLALERAEEGLKQTQISIKQTEISLQQGRSVMLFTIVTILFLPLSFFTSIFGMNNKEWGDNPLSLHQQFRFMFPVSFTVIILSLLLAFSAWTRALTRMLVMVSWAWCVEHTPLHWIWEIIAADPARFEEIEKTYLDKVSARKNSRAEARKQQKQKEEEEREQTPFRQKQNENQESSSSASDQSKSWQEYQHDSPV